jgi:hypothetical protein
VCMRTMQRSCARAGVVKSCGAAKPLVVIGSPARYQAVLDKLPGQGLRM